MTLSESSPGASDPGPRPAAVSPLITLPGFAELADSLPSRGFALRLGDGSRWWLAGSRAATPLPEDMAAIMQLHPGDAPEAGQVLFFYDREKDGRLFEPARLQAAGWHSLRPYSEQFFFLPGMRHVLAEYRSGQPVPEPHTLMALTVPAVFFSSIALAGLPFHAALVERHGQAVILAARGNTGKSTCARRVPLPWGAPCDDEVLVVRSPEGRYLAHPFPTWSDYITGRAPHHTWKVEAALPLAGLFFFEQALEDHCTPLAGYQAALAALHSAEQPMKRLLRWFAPADIRRYRVNMLANAAALVKQVPVFHLKVSFTGRFWEKIAAALGWR